MADSEHPQEHETLELHWLYSMHRLRICIDARLLSGMWGGIEQVIIGLASSLSRLSDGNEEYFFLTYANSFEWLHPYVHGPCRILPGPAVPLQLKALKTAPNVRTALRTLGCVAGRWLIAPPRSDGLLERANIDIVHFVIQLNGFLTDIPSIYHPWDLQHLHLPHLFSSFERRVREARYRAFCDQARMVAVASNWAKEDLIWHYRLPEDKVRVVPLAPVLPAYRAPSHQDLMMTQLRYGLPELFVFYPAQTWPHKNHVRLLEALALLRDRNNLLVPLVCSGRLNEFYPTIKRRVRELHLEGQVHFLGFVSPIELQCLYKLCCCMVFPSKFEGWGMPISEAFLMGAPVACSNVTSLPEQAGDAALFFDPDDPEEIAEAIRRLWTDDSLRQMLIERGRARVARFSWDRIARLFRAHYRRIASYPLTDEDCVLLGGS